VSFLVHGRIDSDALLKAVSHPERGGTVLFHGTVRAGPDDGPVAAIEYSAYDEMAESEFAAIVGEVCDRWPDVSVALRHRLGTVPTGEASIVIAVGAPHRVEAFEACRRLIDEVKLRVPIWKKEMLGDGESRWRSNEPEFTED